VNPELLTIGVGASAPAVAALRIDAVPVLATFATPPARSRGRSRRTAP
jgi:hypothetical protein